MGSRIRFALVSLSMAVLFAQPTTLHADDCSRTWTPGWTGSGIDGQIKAMTLFDFDGPGPATPSLVLAGEFFAIDGEVSQSPVVWDGVRVMSLRPPSTFSFDLAAFETVDLDGAGPLPEQLYARGDFYVGSGFFQGGIIRWTRGFGGQPDRWVPLGDPGEFSYAVGLCAHDFDGPGPESGQVVAVTDSNPLAGAIQRWNGSSWIAVGANNRLTAQAILSVDHDDSGPGLPVLYIQAGNTGVMRLEGDQWTSVQGVIDRFDSIAAFDLDGGGPMGTSLVGVSARGVRLTNLPGTHNALAFDGQAWTPLGTLRSFSNDPAIVRAVPSPGGDVPPSLLLAFSRNPTQLFRWSEIGSGHALAGDWEVVSTLPVTASFNGLIRGLAYFDADGAGRGPPELLVGGSFSLWTGDRWVNYLATVQGSSWRRLTAFSATPDGEVLALKSFDVDADGPRPTVLWVGGDFSTVRGVPMTALAAWDGTEWTSAGTFSANPISARRVATLATFDDDGPGPRPPALYVGGFFNSIDGTIVNHVARLDADGYMPLGSGFSSTTSTSTVGLTAMLVADLDGPGPQRDSLLVAGAFDNVDGRPMGRIAAWSGTSWTPMGSGAPNAVIGLAAIPRLNNSPLLLAVTSDGSLARWNGAFWQTTPFVFDQQVSFARMIDDDGTGPVPACLLVGGRFDTVAGVATPQGLAKYDGQTWTAVTVTDQNCTPEAAAELDLDGPGPQPAQLVLAGFFSNQSGGYHAVAVRTGTGGADDFALEGGYMYPSACYAIEAFADQADSPPGIYIAGRATGVDRYAPTGGLAAAHLAKFGCPPCIAFETQPKGRQIHVGATVTLTADIAFPGSDATYQWRKDGTSVLDGGGTSGATSLSLSVASARLADAGIYDLLVTAPCGQAVSAGAAVTVQCDADLNSDGSLAVGDVFEFLSAYFLGQPRADFSHDFRLSVGDIFAFLQAYFYGC